MNITKLCFGAMLTAAAAGHAMAADSNGRSAAVKAADCAGFTAKDAAPFLAAPADKLVRKIEKITGTLAVCTFAVGTAAPGMAFSIEVEGSAKKSAEQMERYRENLSIAGDTVPWKGKLPKGAYSDIMGPGLGDEAVWTDINGALTVRKVNVTVQVTLPKAKLDQIKVAQAVLAKL